MDFVDAFVNGIVVVLVANIPQGLPATVTSALTLTAGRMKDVSVRAAPRRSATQAHGTHGATAVRTLARDIRCFELRFRTWLAGLGRLLLCTSAPLWLSRFWSRKLTSSRR